ncbi:hypothetical protein V1478_015634 [Vespula squamosa]|uniref:Uncharacterized protein n=1 Tax=Vespula squamosa TaxID=30214 RepID=A0ABD2A1E1_VESSQ
MFSKGAKEEFAGCEMMRWKSGRMVGELGRGDEGGWERQVEVSLGFRETSLRRHPFPPYYYQSAVWCFPPNLPANTEQPLRARYPAMLWYNGESPELSRRHFRRDRALTPSNKLGSEQQ